MKTIHYNTGSIILCFTFFTTFMRCTNRKAPLDRDQGHSVVSTTPPQDGRDQGHSVTSTMPPQDGKDQGHLVTSAVPPQDGRDQGHSVTSTMPPQDRKDQGHSVTSTMPPQGGKDQGHSVVSTTPPQGGRDQGHSVTSTMPPQDRKDQGHSVTSVVPPQDGKDQGHSVTSTMPPQDGRDQGHSVTSTTPPQTASSQSTPIPVYLFPENTTPRMLDYTPNSLIVGKIGSGKTRLLNMLSGSSHRTYTKNGESATRVIIREPVQLENYRGFNLVESPGIDSDVETYKHSFLLKTALEAMPYNAIFLIVPINARTQNVEENLLRTMRLVQEYENNLVLMCSSLDTIMPSTSNKIDSICSNIHRMAVENDIGHTIMYSKKSDPTALANAMYACMSNKDQITIKVSDESFFKKFRMCAGKKEIRRVHQEFQQEADKLLDEYMKKALEVAEEEKHEDVNNILAALGHALGEELEKTVDDFVIKNGLVGTDFKTEVAFLEMKKKKLQVSDKFLQETNKLML